MRIDDVYKMIANGEIEYYSSVYKFGRNQNVGTTEVLISHENVYGLPTTAETVTATSTSGNDVPAGSGARTITIRGLNQDYNLASETIDMGATTTTRFIRVFRAFIETAGNINPTAGANDGTITIEQSTSGIEMVKIAPNDGQTLTACYTVPANYVALMWAADTTVGEGKTSINRLKSREFGTDKPFRTKGIRDNFENTVGVKLKIPTLYEEKTDIVFTGISTAAGTSVSGTFQLQLWNKAGD